MPDEDDQNEAAYDTVKRATNSGDVDAGEFIGSAELAEKLRRVKMRKMVGYGPQGIIYLDD